MMMEKTFFLKCSKLRDLVGGFFHFATIARDHRARDIFTTNNGKKMGAGAVAGVGAGQGKPWTGATAQCHLENILRNAQAHIGMGAHAGSGKHELDLRDVECSLRFRIRSRFEDMIEQHLALSTRQQLRDHAALLPVCQAFTLVAPNFCP